MLKRLLTIKIIVQILYLSASIAQPYNLVQEFSTFWGGNGRDGAYVQLDKEGFIYIMGQTLSSDLPTTPGAFDTTLNGESDLYISKLSPDGKTLVYSTYLGGDGTEGHSWHIKVDETGCVYILGATTSGDLPVTENAVDSTYNGNLDLFIAKLDPSGSDLLYCSYFGGSDDEFPSDIELDEEGNIYISAMTNSDNIPVSYNAYDKTRNSSLDIFITKINPDNNELLYSTFIGGTDIGKMVIDEEGNCYVTTLASIGNNLPTTNSVFGKNFYGGNADAYIIKLNSSGSDIVFATFLGGSAYDIAGDLQFDSNRNLVLYGFTYSPNFPTTPGVYTESYSGNSQNLFITKIDTNATQVISSSFFLGSCDGYMSSMEIDDNDNIYFTIIAGSPGLPCVQNAFDMTYNENNDGYFMIVNPELTQILYSTYIGTEGREYLYSMPGPDCVYLCGASTSSDFPVTTDSFFPEYRGGERDGFIMKFIIDKTNSTENIEGQPTGFRLKQNFPNPFNPTTEISYSLNKPGDVKLEIFNSLGQHIKTLADNYHATGTYSVVWDGSNLNSRQVPSGIYIYKLTANNTSTNRKMMFLK